MTDDDTELDQLFAAARKERATLPDDLAVRIQTDAEAIRLQNLPKPTRSIWARALDGVYGWQGMGGLVAASAAGLWIGMSAPAFLPDPASFLFSQDADYIVADLGLDASFLEDAE